jgi:formyltetrahydrofolate deformylase
MPDATKHILLMDGPDSKGLIYHVTGVLYRHNLNIIHNDEYVSPAGKSMPGHFFMRTEFEGTFDSALLLSELNATLPNAEGITFRLNPKRKKNIVVLVTKEHHCLGELLIRYAFDELDADILAVVSNYNVLQPLVSKFGIPFHHVSHEDKTREEHEEAIRRTLNIYEPEYLVLAKYMRVLTPAFVDHFPNRIINIHHSFLPAFVGANPYRQAYERAGSRSPAYGYRYGYEGKGRGENSAFTGPEAGFQRPCVHLGQPGYCVIRLTTPRTFSSSASRRSYSSGTVDAIDTAGWRYVIRLSCLVLPLR